MTRDNAERLFRTLAHLSNPGEVPPGYEATKPEELRGLLPARSFDGFLASNKIQIIEEIK